LKQTSHEIQIDNKEFSMIADDKPQSSLEKLALHHCGQTDAPTKLLK
jgi:hypothetical protein